MRVELRLIRRALQDRTTSSLDIEGKKIIAFSGIGDTGSFYDLLIKAGSIVAKNFAFQDHHWYSGADIEKIAAARKEFKADYIVTTEKDTARLKDKFSGFLENEGVLVAEICQEILSGEEKLYEVIKNKLPVAV
jgi:tetraacyldisaccharide 4'-kinase